MPAVDEMLTIEPPPDVVIARAALCIPSHTPITLTSSSRANSSGVSSRNGRASRITAALFTRPSSRPCVPTASSTTRVQSSARVTSCRSDRAGVVPGDVGGDHRRALGAARLRDHRTQRAPGAGDHDDLLGELSVGHGSAEHEALVALGRDLVAPIHVVG